MERSIKDNYISLVRLGLPEDPGADTIHDSRSPGFLHAVRQKANQLYTSFNGNPKSLAEFEEEIFREQADAKALGIDIGGHLAIKLARSKAIIDGITQPMKISVVVPVYHEVNRVRPREGSGSSEVWRTLEGQDPHPNGENFVHEKDKQIGWLTENNPNVAVSMIYVDDGCDQNSGEIIERLISINGYRKKNSVHYLEDLVEKKQQGLLKDALSDIDSTRESQKAGAVYSGMAIAVNNEADIIAYTDADLSYDLGQLGILIEPIIEGKTNVSVANRRHPLSYTEDVNSTGKHPPEKRRMKALLGSLRGALLSGVLPEDTQAGFKAFSSETTKKLLELPNKDNGLTFDIQLLGRQHLINGDIARSVGVVCIDSPEETTADGEHTYRSMSGKYLDIAREVGAPLDTKPYMILSRISGENMQHPDQVWNDMQSVMRMDGSALDKIGYTAAHQISQYFDVPSNNTAVSISLNDEIIHSLDRVTSIFSKESNPQ